MPLQDLQQMPPAKGQHPSVACLLQGTGEGWERDTEAHQLVTVHDGRHQIQVGNLDIVIDELVDLAV